jgi:hypothetical protein
MLCRRAQAAGRAAFEGLWPPDFLLGFQRQ